MARFLKSSPILWLGVGLVVGLVLGGLWPQTPLHAVATDRIDTFAMATGPVDEDAEAVYFLDFLTGDLRAVVISKTTGKFTAFYAYNVLTDLGVDVAKNPRFLMVTGLLNLRRGGSHVAPAKSTVYVAEVTTGKVGAYCIPWSAGAHGGTIIKAAFLPLDSTRFRAAVGAPSTTGGGAAATK
jgi:hypothetical protein